MPSDAITTAEPTEQGQRSIADRAYEALSGRIETFRHAVAMAEQEVHEDLTRRSRANGSREERVVAELGPFARGRIDPERFAMLLGMAEEELTSESLDVLGKADAILTGFAQTSNHRVTVEPGGDLRDVVKHGLAHLGQTFGAARAVELARAGTFDLIDHGYLLGPLPFRLWNRAERGLAPPLLVEVRGEDCLPAGLGEFLDGAVTIVIVATGPTTPAPLARLVTPGTFVMQTAELADLEKVGDGEHPAVILLFDEDRPGQAHFVHEPEAGTTPWSRMSVSRMPTDADVGRGRKAPAWLEELEHLRTLAAAPVGPTPPTAPGGTVAPEEAGTASSASGPTQVAPSPTGADAGADAAADRLAAWLLANTDVSDL